MITLKIALVAMMINSSVAPMHNADINKAINYTKPPEVIDYNISNGALPRDLAPARQDTNAINTKEEAPAAQTINKDKTYEQCAKEAFEYIYNEVNKMLDKESEQYDERFWLQSKI